MQTQTERANKFLETNQGPAVDVLARLLALNTKINGNANTDRNTDTNTTRYTSGNTNRYTNTNTFLETNQGPGLDVLARLQLVAPQVPRHRIGNLATR